MIEEDEYENEELSIQSIIPNHDNSLISVIKSNKVLFFDTSNFKEYADGLGDSLSNVSICLPYYRSHIVIIVGNRGNVTFPHNKIVLWNIIEQRELGMIELNIGDDESIMNLYVNTRALVVILLHKILLFDIISLDYITTFEDVNGEKKGLISIRSIKDFEPNTEITIAYVSYLNNHNIKIIKIRFSFEKTTWSQQLIATDLEGIQFISIGTKARFIAVVCSKGEKINLYSLKTYKVKKYLWRGHNKGTIVDIVFDPYEKFMCLFSLQKTFHFYPLLSKHLQSSNQHHDENDGQDYYIYNQPEQRRNSFFKSKKRKYKQSHAQYKNETLLNEQIMYFYLNEKADLIAINKKGKVFHIKMNKKNGGMCTLTQTKRLDTSDM